MNAVIPYVDIMFGNETEAAAMGEKMGWGSDIPTIAKNLAALPKASGLKCRTVIITQVRPGAATRAERKRDTLEKNQPKTPSPLFLSRPFSLRGRSGTPLYLCPGCPCAPLPLK